MAKVQVRAKFKVEKKNPWNGGAEILMCPVYDSDPDSENGRFFDATPGGSISLSTVSPAAAAAFEVGREYYVDFIPADQAEGQPK